MLIPLARHAQTLHRLAILDERAVGECGGQIEERRRALEGERGLALLAEGLEGVFPHVVDVESPNVEPTLQRIQRRQVAQHVHTIVVDGRLAEVRQ